MKLHMIHAINKPTVNLIIVIDVSVIFIISNQIPIVNMRVTHKRFDCCLNHGMNTRGR